MLIFYKNKTIYNENNKNIFNFCKLKTKNSYCRPKIGLILFRKLFSKTGITQS